MAGNEVRDALKSSAETIAKYVKDVATLSVTTYTQEVGNGSAGPVPAAKTTISLDGDNSSVLPTQKNEAGRLEVDAAIYELHTANVKSAIEYRARMLQSMLELLRTHIPH
jgi:hypothetical protein